MKNIGCSLVVIVLLATFVYAKNEIQLRSDVVKGRLIPTIVINGKTVMKIQDRGDREKYESGFDRAERIYSTLVDLEEKGQDLGKIRVRRFKTDYSGHLKKTMIFSITRGDIQANGITAYKLSRLWVDNIKNALKPVSLGDILDEEMLDEAAIAFTEENTQVEKHKNMFPLMFIMNLFSKKGVIFFLFQLIFFALLQVVIAYGVVHHNSKKQLERDRAVQSRLDKLQYAVSNHKQDIHDLAKNMKDIKKTVHSKPIDVLKRLKVS